MKWRLRPFIWHLHSINPRAAPSRRVAAICCITKFSFTGIRNSLIICNFSSILHKTSAAPREPCTLATCSSIRQPRVLPKISSFFQCVKLILWPSSPPRRATIAPAEHSELRSRETAVHSAQRESSFLSPLSFVAGKENRAEQMLPCFLDEQLGNQSRGWKG
jgi:hypothetical protein